MKLKCKRKLKTKTKKRKLTYLVYVIWKCQRSSRTYQPNREQEQESVLERLNTTSNCYIRFQNREFWNQIENDNMKPIFLKSWACEWYFSFKKQKYIEIKVKPQITRNALSMSIITIVIQIALHYTTEHHLNHISNTATITAKAYT
jgi:hypothetical protein